MKNILPDNIQVGLQGSGYQPDAKDYELLIRAVSELQDGVNDGTLSGDYSDIIYDHMVVLAKLEGLYGLSDRISVIVEVTE